MLVGAQSLTAGHGKSRLEADTLNGWQEVAPSPPATGNAGLASKGSGEFKAEIDDDNQTVEWKLSYTGLARPRRSRISTSATGTSRAASPCSSAAAGPRVMFSRPARPV